MGAVRPARPAHANSATGRSGAELPGRLAKVAADVVGEVAGARHPKAQGDLPEGELCLLESQTVDPN